MRSKRNTALVACARALATGGLLAIGATSVSAQAGAGGFPLGGPSPAYSPGPAGTGAMPSGPGGSSPYGPGAASPYGPGAASPYGPGASPTYAPRSTAPITSETSAPAASMSPYAPGAAGSNSPYAPRHGIPLDPATTPASASASAPSMAPASAMSPTSPMTSAPTPPLPSTSPPNWGTVAATEPVKKPSAMRRFFSFILHGGSTRESEAESRPIHRDPTTGRTDLQNARPWLGEAPH